ncbi:MAG: hypothetical protein AB1807_13420 [Pseudomonadota bacterium]|jgi:hypothetical protein
MNDAAIDSARRDWTGTEVNKPPSRRVRTLRRRIAGCAGRKKSPLAAGFVLWFAEVYNP